MFRRETIGKRLILDALDGLELKRRLRAFHRNSNRSRLLNRCRIVKGSIGISWALCGSLYARSVVETIDKRLILDALAGLELKRRVGAF